jgi:hypothetical protein
MQVFIYVRQQFYPGRQHFIDDNDYLIVINNMPYNHRQPLKVVIGNKFIGFN